jgi:PAS domain S-box-containing protein
MGNTSVLAVIQNLSLLLAMALLFDLYPFKYQRNKFHFIQIPVGILLGGIGIVLILTPWVFFPGIFIDTRNILLSISGLFFGTVPTVIAMVILVVFRIILGGVGLPAGVMMIITSGLIGLAWRHLRKKPLRSIRINELYFFGLIIQINMLLWTALFPGDMVIYVLQTIVLPLMLIFPIGTVLLGMLMINRLRREKATEELQNNESRLHRLLDFVQSANPEQQMLLNQALQDSVSLTDSGFGCLYSYASESAQPRIISSVNPGSIETSLINHVLELIRVQETTNPEQGNLVKPVICNHYKSSLNNYKPCSYMSIPIINDNKVVALVGLIKKTGEYEELDSLQITLLMESIWKTIERHTVEKSLSSIEWMLSKGHHVSENNEIEQTVNATYDVLISQNTGGVILNSVGRPILEDIARDYLDLLDTSAIIYEKDGNYALAMFASTWCLFMNDSSRNLCPGTDLSENIKSGKWLCHESCWTQSSKVSIETKKVADIECEGGLHIFSTPIFSNGEVIGAISFGYGNPPKDQSELEQIAQKYQVDVQQLSKLAESYESRPPFIIELAKQRLQNSAKLIEVLIERNQAQKELHLNESLLSRIIDIMPIGLWLADKNGKLIRGNNMAEKIWGGQPLVDSSSYGVFHARRLPSREEIAAEDWALAHTIREGITIENELLEIDTFDGEKKIILNYTTPITSPTGSIEGAVVVNLDITERMQAEEKINQTKADLQRLLEEADQARLVLLSLIEDQKFSEEKINLLNQELEQRVRDRTIQLEVANRELEAFAYSVSHDLRAPLRAMDGFSAALLEDYQDKLDEQGKHYLFRIQEASRHMGQLIEDLLHLSRVTRRELHFEQINLSVIAQDIAEDLMKQVQGQALEIKIMDSLFVMADSHLMHIALENLMSNAFKFSSKQEKPCIEIGVMEKKGEKVYYVRDNGVGFNMKYVDKLFTPFQRLHSIEEFPGTGIGLVTVQRIINRHGGIIWPEAALNQGATFFFTLGGLQ